MRLLNIILILLYVSASGIALAQEKKGDLEDFADDYGEEEASEDADHAAEFFLVALVDHFEDFARLWGRTPGTEFGPYPSHPYEDGDGFMSASNNTYRSYFFNTELDYHPLSSRLRSYLLKWETHHNSAPLPIF